MEGDQNNRKWDRIETDTEVNVEWNGSKILLLIVGLVIGFVLAFFCVPSANAQTGSATDKPNNLALALSGAEVITQPTWQAPRPVPLDFNNDGSITLDDITAFEFVLAGGEVANAASLDINGDETQDDRDRDALYEGYFGGVTHDALLGLNVKPRGGSTSGYVPADDQPCPPGVTCYRSIGQAMRAGARVILLGGGDHGLRDGDGGGEYVGGGWQNDGLTYGGTRQAPLIIATDPTSPVRARLHLPSTVSAGMRATDDVRFVTLRGLHLVCGTGQFGVVVSGTASDIRIIDCIIDGGPGGSDGSGGYTGIKVEGSRENGVDKRPTRVTVAYTIIFGQQFTPHTQGLYASNYGVLDVFNNVFWKCGKLGSQFDQAMYLVHGAPTRPRIIGNFIGMPGSAVIQGRGSDDAEFGWNVGFWFNTGIGIGHPMGYRDGVWSNARVHNNLLADPRLDGTAPARWFISHMAGRTNVMTHNVLRGYASPGGIGGGDPLGPFAFMTGQDQRGGAENTPVGQFVIRGTNASSEGSGVQWYAELAARLSREHGQWNEGVHGTRQLIESVRARTPAVN